MLEDLRHLALEGRTAREGLCVNLREMPPRGMIDLRGHAGDRKFMAAAKNVLAAALPVKPRTSMSWGDVKALWLSVDQWLVLCPMDKLPELMASFASALEGLHALAVDVSDMRSVIRLEGDAARLLLLKGSSLDLLGPDYPVGTVRRMRFAEIAALLHVVSESPDVIDLYIFRSYAVYAWEWLLRNGGSAALPPRIGPQPAPMV